MRAAPGHRGAPWRDTARARPWGGSAHRGGPGAPPGAHVPGSAAIATPPGPLRPARRDRSLGGPGACKKANRNRGALAAMASPRGLSPGRGKKAPTSRPGRGRRRCPGSGPVVADTASRESSEVPRGPGFKETGNSFQCREPAPRRSHRPPARGPAPTHRAPKFRRCGSLGGLGPARRSGRGRQAGVGLALAEGPGAGFPHPPSRVRGTKTRTCVRCTELRGGVRPPARCAPPISRGFHAALRLGRDAFGVGADARAGAAPKIPLTLSAVGKGIPKPLPRSQPS